ncbi:MAG: exodeoxyribonuclease V subunit beta [Desulfobacteraceae bacterium]|nr:exodeoxyribonuclease V subunit beta [Desulfobacteraceae bacterium]
MKIFDPFKTDINNLTTLIEASAGTGKTYTITSIVLRLILEKGLAIEEILVVTFTEAAASELKDRILKRLRDALKGFEFFLNNQKEQVEDPYILSLIESCKDLDSGMEKIICAIRNFDLSCIFTIHGFCYKILSEHAFETKNFFESKILTDESLLIQKCADDFYRKYIDECSYKKADILFKENIGPKDIASIVKKYSNYHDMKIESLKPSEEFEKVIEEFNDYEKEAAKIWKSEKKQIISILSDSDIFKKTFSGHEYLDERTRYLDTVFESDGNPVSVYASDKINGRKNPFFYFTSSEISKGVKKGKKAKDHIFFEKAQALYERAIEADEERLKFIFDFKKTGFIETSKLLFDLKEDQKILGFGDFLIKLKTALDKDTEDNLKNILRKKYKAALIDEFQDTDIIQYEIFKKIFKGYSPLFFIGDPKQAIYRFRGADIFAYLNAKKDADQIFTLNKNYRSSHCAVKAVNNIFSYSNNPFSIEEINYIKIEAAKPQNDSMIENGRVASGVEFVLMTEEAAKKVPDKKKFILKYIVSEISRLLSMSQNKNLSINDKEILLSDIAILVKENQFGREIRKYLEENNIPSVLTSEESVFDTEEAENILEFLDCVENYSNERKIKKVLTGGLFLMSASNLNNALSNESEWTEILNKFKMFNELWTNSSVMEMLNSLYYEHNILNIQAKLVSGERRVSNLIHIFEVLHEEEMKNRHGKKSLINWLADKIYNSSSSSEEFQLRMESDRKKLKIMTVHKSKGLEFPIVFCAFFPKKKMNINKDGVLYHDMETQELILDFSADLNQFPKAILNEELIAEDLRTFYVSVTRAKYKTYVFLGFDEDKNDSYALRLFSKKQNMDSDNYSNETKDVFSTIKMISANSEGSISFCIHESPKNFPLHNYSISNEIQIFKRCEFNKEIEKSFQISSFSLVSSKKEKDDERFDSQSEKTPDKSKINDNELNIFNFPKGAFAGIFFHSIFEDLNFCASHEEIEDLVKLKLEKYGFEKDWLFCITQMVENVLNKELESGLFLKNIKNDKKITELEFFYPLQENEINNYLKKLGSLELKNEFREILKNIYANESKGFMKGFIDLVFEHENRFYVLDWKSNHLGFSYSDYEPEKLFPEICSNLYFLQYYIYSYSLDKYLRYRLGNNYSYSQNFGGVYYLFIRGIDDGNGKNGVFYDMPLKVEV